MTTVSLPPPPAYDDLLRHESPPPYDADRLPDYSAQEPPSALLADVLTIAIASVQRVVMEDAPGALPVRPWLPESTTMRALRLPDALARQPRPAFHPLFDPIAGEALAAASLSSVATLFAHSCGVTFSVLQAARPFPQSLRGVVTREMLGRWRQLGAGAQLDEAAYARAATQLEAHMAVMLGSGPLEAEVAAADARSAWARAEVAPMLASCEVLGFEAHLSASHSMFADIVGGRPPQRIIDIFRSPHGRDPAQGRVLREALDVALELARAPREPGGHEAATLNITMGLAGLRAWIWLTQLL